MADDFAHDVGRKLCLQLCSLAGYGAVNDSALDVLTDLTEHFLKQTSGAARSYAENAGRTDINAQDIVTTRLASSTARSPVLGPGDGAR